MAYERREIEVRLKNVKCWICDKLGHIASECSDKKKADKDDKDNKKQREHEKRKCNTNDKVAFLANNLPTIGEVGWIVDSAASVHMSSNKKLFRSIVTFENSEVVIADNQRLRRRKRHGNLVGTGKR